MRNAVYYHHTALLSWSAGLAVVGGKNEIRKAVVGE
jgi:hypothetical protein